MTAFLPEDFAAARTSAEKALRLAQAAAAAHADGPAAQVTTPQPASHHLVSRKA